MIGCFTVLYLGSAFRKNTERAFLRDFCLAGGCLVVNSLQGIIRELRTLPYFLMALGNTATLAIHLCVLSALYSLFRMSLPRYSLLTFAGLSYMLWFIPVVQHDLVTRLLLAFSAIIVLNLWGKPQRKPNC